MVMVMDESVAKLYCPDHACTSMRMLIMMPMKMMMVDDDYGNESE